MGLTHRRDDEHGGRGVAVSTIGCEPVGVGSNPIGHPLSPLDGASTVALLLESTI